MLRKSKEWWTHLLLVHIKINNQKRILLKFLLKIIFEESKLRNLSLIRVDNCYWFNLKDTLFNIEVLNNQCFLNNFKLTYPLKRVC